MKIILKYIFILFFVFGQNFLVLAMPALPTPSQGGPPAPPPGLPVNDGILYLLFTGVCLGLYVIKKSYIKKAST